LKLIVGTVRPTVGQIAVAGRISAILELGLGFNPELTGRQNVCQAGGLMRLPQHELSTLMPEIEDFAELGAFFDQPLRVYFSPMQARLAFSLATTVKPKRLIVDEVLSVGDSYFQHKSFDRIRQFKDDGTAILFVSTAWTTCARCAIESSCSTRCRPAVGSYAFTISLSSSETHLDNSYEWSDMRLCLMLSIPIEPRSLEQIILTRTSAFSGAKHVYADTAERCRN
jgi:hypothetical protein